MVQADRRWSLWCFDDTLHTVFHHLFRISHGLSSGHVHTKLHSEHASHQHLDLPACFLGRKTMENSTTAYCILKSADMSGVYWTPSFGWWSSGYQFLLVEWLPQGPQHFVGLDKTKWSQIRQEDTLAESFLRDQPVTPVTLPTCAVKDLPLAVAFLLLFLRTSLQTSLWHQKRAESASDHILTARWCLQ